MMVSVVACASCGVKNSPDRTACFQCGADVGILTVPPHLASLLLPTPSAVAKLIAAWDGLSVESQILILTKIKTTKLPEYLSERIYVKALESNNSYIRYLAAKELRVNGDDAIRRRIEQDQDMLVRYCLFETRESSLILGDSDVLKDADTFFALPHEARLAVIRSMVQHGNQIAGLIGHAIEHQLKEGRASEIELYEIVCDYVNKPSFREYYTSWGDRYRYEYPLSELSDIRALWELVPRLPEPISYMLTENLPAKIANEPTIPDEVPKQLSPRQIEELLNRSDVGLETFRKEVFWNTAPHDLMTWTAAASHNFNLDFTEFARILGLPTKERVEILRHLAGAEELSPYLYDAIYDALLTSDEIARKYPWPLDWPPKVEARLSAVQGLHEFTGAQAREFFELRDLGIYRLARAAVRSKKGEWGYPLNGDLEFLAKHVVQGDEWGTFIAFHKACETDDKGI